LLSTVKELKAIVYSQDGLFSIIDARIQDEDDAILGVGNIDASLKKASWINSTPESPVLCLTDHECVSIWSSNEPELMHEYGDLRERILTDGWTADYLLDSIIDAKGEINLFLASKTSVHLFVRLFAKLKQWG